MLKELNQLDASWIILYQTNGEKYTVTNRGLRYIFESDKELSFYFDDDKKIYDSATGKLVKDKISILNFNTKPDQLIPFTNDINWEITGAFRNEDGYVNSKKVEVSFFDLNDDGSVDDPDVFDIIVDENVNPLTKYIILKKVNSEQGYSKYNYYGTGVTSDRATGSNVVIVNTESEIGSFIDYENGQVFYIIDIKTFKQLSGSLLAITSDYQAYLGRDNLKFHYVHSADESNRIDPSASNIIDVYMLTRAYDIEYRKYIAGTISTEPLPPSSDELFQNYGALINSYKSISDEVIYHPVAYKTLFGSHSDDRLQAEFKVVKNAGLVINNNDLKSRIISSINKFFALQNWDFGESFFFSELVTFVMNENAPDISNLVIVPKQANQSFGSLYEIKCEDYELFISDATVDDIQIIDSITASRLQASGNVVTSTGTTNTGITSQPLSTGGSSY